MSEGPFDFLDEDPQFKEYSRHFLMNVLPLLQDSAFAVSIAPSNRGGHHEQGNVKYWVELGASIMFDKPIICIIEPGQEIPVRLRRVADIIVEADISTEEGQNEASEKIAVAIAKLEDQAS